MIKIRPNDKLIEYRISGFLVNSNGNIVAAIKKHYDKFDLIDKYKMIVSNLIPRMIYYKNKCRKTELQLKIICAKYEKFSKKLSSNVDINTLKLTEKLIIR